MEHPTSGWLSPALETYIIAAGFFLSCAHLLEWHGIRKLIAMLLIAFVPAVIVYFWLNKKKEEFRTFLGVTGNSKVKLVLSTYKNRHEYEPEGPAERRLRYYKKDIHGRLEYLVGSTRFLTGSDTAATGIYSAIELARLNLSLEVVGDEDLRTTDAGPVISLGSPTSNFVTKRLLEGLPKSVEVKFTTDTMMCLWLHAYPYKSSHEYDYAVLARIVDQTGTFFVCAGIDEEGTVASARFLLRNWKALHKSQFVQILKCDKVNYSATKVGGKHTQEAIWITD